MNREQAVELVRIYDGQYPHEYEELYLDYFELSPEDFHKILEKWTNKELFAVANRVVTPKFVVT